MIWLAVVPIAGHELRVVDPSGRSPLRVELGAVVVLALAAAVAGWGLIALLERFTGHARMAWAVTAALVLLVSLLPLTGPGTALSTRLALGLMHLAVASVLVPGLMLTSPASRKEVVAAHRSEETAHR